MNFSELNISNSLQRSLQEKGFQEASDIQSKVIPNALLGKDIVGKSKTGTGKTAAFGIPLIENIQAGERSSALIVVPTRELASQVKDEISSIANGSRVQTVAVFGGQSINLQINLLHKNPEIIVGTPGRLLDLLSRGALNFSRTRFLILDEADRMFDMGFRDDVEKIISVTPRERQTMLFSATMPESIRHLVHKHLNRDKVIVDLSRDNAPVQEVDQFYVMVPEKKKIDSLQRVLKNNLEKTLIFCRTKRTVDWLERQLGRRGLRVLAIHGDKPQNTRTRIVDKFKRSSNGVLVATDVVARGIHVDDIGNVINFDFPEEKETYIHRIGRTARQGKKGKAISFCGNVMELERLERISSRNKSSLQELH